MEKKGHIGFQVRHLSKMMRCRLHQKEMASGADPITATHGWIIGYLFDHQNEDIYQKDLEREFHMARSSITGIVQVMENNGYIKRTPVEHDARLKKIELTELGCKFHDTTHENMDELEEEVRKGISQTELDTFFRVLEKMKDNLREYEDDSCKDCKH